MKNKVLINLIVPALMDKFEIFIPVNERVSKLKELLLNSLSDLTDNEFNKDKSYSLIDPETGTIYENDMIIRETDLKNVKKVILY